MAGIHLGQARLDAGSLIGALFLHSVLQEIKKQMVVAQGDRFFIHGQDEQVIAQGRIHERIPIQFQVEGRADHFGAKSSGKFFQQRGAQQKLLYIQRLFFHHLLGQIIIQTHPGHAQHPPAVRSLIPVHLAGQQQAGDPTFGLAHHFASQFGGQHLALIL